MGACHQVQSPPSSAYHGRHARNPIGEMVFPGLGDDDLDLQGIQEAFDRPKAKPVDVNINLFLGFDPAPLFERRVSYGAA